MTYQNFTVEQLESEVWKPIHINGYEDLYEVSNLGRVKNLGTHCHKQGAYIRKPQLSKGYLRITLYNKGEYKICSVHRLVMIAFCGEEIEKKNQINHINGIKTDNRLENLEYCSAKENHEHAIKLGLKRRGNPKLSLSDVLIIREKLKNKEKSQVALAIEYNVKPCVISAIYTKRSWKDANN